VGQHPRPRADSSDFPRLGDAFARETGAVRSGRVENAEAKLMPQREIRFRKPLA